MPLPLLHKRSTLKGTFEELLNPVCDDETRMGYVRLEVTDSFVGLEALSQLKQVYPRILEICDKNFEKTDGTVTLSTEKLEQMESDPIEVFRWFCREEMELEADEHLAELFQSAVEEAEKEAEA